VTERAPCRYGMGAIPGSNLCERQLMMLTKRGYPRPAATLAIERLGLPSARRQRRSGVAALSASTIRSLVSQGCRLLQPLLIIVGIASGFCLDAAGAQIGAGAPGNSQVPPEVSPADDAQLVDETGWRYDQLINQDFEKKKIVVFDPEHPEIEVPPNGESMISLWFATAHGTFTMQLLELHDGDRSPVVSWPPGRRGEQTLVGVLAPGRKYVVELHASDGARVHGVIGIKSLFSSCSATIAGLTEYPAKPDAADLNDRYYWPYLLVRPSAPVAGPHRLPGADTLLVVPDNTEVTDDLQVIRAWATCALVNPKDIEAIKIAESLGTPILVPLFPRPNLKKIASNLQLQALTRATLDDIPEKMLSRVDLQLIAMIDDARKRLKADGWPIRRRVLMAGLSAAGQFTNRFAVLHPDRVLAAAVGAPGSWPVAPVAAERGAKLRYPVGIADVKELTGLPVDIAALRRVRFLFFRGHLDDKDTVGQPDNYAARDTALIERLFGNSILRRWCSAKKLYHDAGLHRAQFKLYTGVKHKVTPGIRKDIIALFRTALGAR